MNAKSEIGYSKAETSKTRALSKLICVPMILASIATVLVFNPARAFGADPKPHPTEVNAETHVHVKEKATPVLEAPTSAKPLHRGVTYGGVLHDVVKSDQPYQMLNPMAPAHYGSGENNVVRDPVSKQPRGIALFSIRW